MRAQLLARKLCRALEKEDAEAVDTLLKKGADPNLLLPDGIAAVHLAAGKERERAVRCLNLILQHGGNPNARSVEELTPLHVAASWGCYKCLELLLRSGGDPSLKDQDGNYAIDLAVEQGNRKCFMLLQDYCSYILPEDRNEENSPKKSHDSYSKRNQDSLFSSVGTDTSSVSGPSERSSEVGLLNSTRKSLLSPVLTSKLNNTFHDETVIAGINFQVKQILLGFQDSQSTREKALQASPCSSGITWHAPKPSDRRESSECFLPRSAVLSSTRVSSSDQGIVNAGNLPEDESILGISETSVGTSLHKQEPVSSQRLQVLSCYDKDSGCDLAQTAVLCSSHMSPSRKYTVNSTSQYVTEGFASGDSSGVEIFAPLKHHNSEGDNLATANGHAGCKMLRDGSESSLTRLDSSVRSSSWGKKKVSFCKTSSIIPPQELENGLSCSSRISNLQVTPNSSENRKLLNSDNILKILENQGLDVTSPDHVYLFYRGSPSPGFDLDKTVINPAALQTREQTEGGDLGSDLQAQHCGSSSTKYGSCDSEWYISAAEISTHEQDLPRSSEDKEHAQEMYPTKYMFANCKGTNAGSLLEERKTPSTQESSLQSTIGSDAQDTVPLKDISANAEQQAQLQDVFFAKQYRSPAAFCTSKAESSCTELVPNKEVQKQASDNLLANSESLPSQETLPVMALQDGTQQQDTMGDLSKQLKLMMLATKWKKELPLHSQTQDTVMIDQDSVASSNAESKDASLSTELKKMLRATKTYEPSVSQGSEIPCYITPRTKSRLTSSIFRSSSSPSLFDDTLDMPKRGRRLRNPEGSPQCMLARDSLMKGYGLKRSQVNEENTTHCQHPPMREPGTLKLDNTKIVQNEMPPCSSQRKSNIPIACSSMVLLKRDAEGNFSDFFTDDRSSSGSEGQKHDTMPCADLCIPLPAKAFLDNTWLTEDEENSCTDTTTCMTAAPLSRKAYVGAGNSKQLFHSTRLDDPRLSEMDERGQICMPRYSFSRLSLRRPLSVMPIISTNSDKLMAVEDASSYDITLSPGGRPVNMSRNEPVEYLYTDNEKGHALIERHIPCTDETTVDTTSSEETIIYDWRMYKSKLEVQECKDSQSLRTDSSKIRLDLLQLSNEEIERRLRDFGENPGPITSLNRRICLVLLDKLMNEQLSRNRKETLGYSPELTFALQTFQIPECHDDEVALSKQFDQPDRKKRWREGILKSSFNYLLLDPRVTRNLPARCHNLSQVECFCTFVNAIFYVGKGKRSRPYCHLYEALTHYKTGRKQKCSKVQQILDVWQAGLGVISLHCFQNVIPVEAYTREACMVDAIGLKMLTNRKKGDYYGCSLSWPMKRRRCLGVHMLYRAMQIFLAEGERQLRPADIRIGQ